MPLPLAWSFNPTTGVLSVSASNLVRGDFNRDGHFDASDIAAMLAVLADLNDRLEIMTQATQVTTLLAGEHVGL